QFMLAPRRDDPAAVEQGNDIIEACTLPFDRTHEHRRAAVGGLGRELGKQLRRPFGERGLEDQILGRIADQLELGVEDEVGIAVPGAHLAHRGGVGGEIADRLRHLRKDDGKRFGRGHALPIFRHRRRSNGGEATRPFPYPSALAKGARNPTPRERASHPMKLISGNSNLPLARAIADYLELPLTDTSVRRFADEEVFVEIHENVRGQDVFVVQPTNFPANDNLMELLILNDALRRASAKRITAVVPYFGYARQDRKPGPRTPISAKLVANLITTSGADRVLAIDLHAGQIQGFFDIPTDNLYAAPVMSADIQARFGDKNLMVVSPDVGGVVRARALAKRLDNAPLAIVDKRRERAGESEVMNIIGDVSGRFCILIDDIVDSGGTLCNAAQALKDKGATEVVAYITHGVLSGGAVARINGSVLKELVITDSICATEAVE